jgi:hypothetical protein
MMKIRANTQRLTKNKEQNYEVKKMRAKRK